MVTEKPTVTVFGNESDLTYELKSSKLIPGATI